MKQSNNSFNFFIPFEIIKGSSSDPKRTMKIKGIASSHVEDSDGEFLDPTGFNLQPLLESGFFNYNHQASKTASAIIGEPTVAKIINDGKDLYVEGFLYDDSPEAKAVYQLGLTLEKNSDTRRLGFSIEGQATERDPLNPKKVTKANLTSIAITPSPKNPNTLLSIMKGEYKSALESSLETKEDDEDEDEKKDKKEKAISAEGSAITKEDVDHSPRNIPYIDDTKKIRIKKIGIYKEIFKSFKVETKEQAKTIYSFIESTQKKLDMSAEISNEAINKAIENLKAEMSILEKAKKDEMKSDSKEPVKKVKKSDEDSEEEGSDMEKSKKIVKSEDDEEDKDEEVDKDEDKVKEAPKVPAAKKEDKSSDEVKKGDQEVSDNLTARDNASEAKGVSKAKDDKDEDEDDEDGFVKKMAKKRIEKGMSKEVAISDMTKKGISLEAAQNAVASVVAEMGSLEANGGATEVKTDLTKGFSDLADLIKSQNTEFTATIQTLVATTSLQAAENDVLKKSLEAVTARLNKMESEPVGRKSVVTAKAVERFEKGHVHEGKTVININSKEGINSLTDTLMAVWDKGGNKNQTLAKAISHIDIHKGIDDQSILTSITPYLNEQNIVLTK